MDYNELKKKYGGSEQNSGRKPSRLIVICVLIVVLAVSAFVYFFYFTPLDRANAVLKDLESLSPDEITVNAISKQRCQSLTKNNRYWLVRDCEDDVEFKLFLYGNDYQLGYCANWQTRREAFDKLKQFFGSPECVDQSLEDKKIEEPPWIGKDYDVYNVCGLKIMFRDNCIISVVGD